MVEIKRIIAAIDFSSFSNSLLSYAGALSERTGAEVVGVSVIDSKMIESVERVFNGEGRIFSAKRFLSDETYRRTQALKELLDSSLPKHVPRRIVIRSGIAYSEIIEAIKNEQADMLIIARKGTTNILNQLIGTTAEKLFRHSPVTVLSVSGTS